MRAIIGPNGAGKTTMMDVITGKTGPNSGFIQARQIIGLLEMRRAAVGPVSELVEADVRRYLTV